MPSVSLAFTSGVRIRTLGGVDQRRHRDDVDIAGTDVFGRARELQLIGKREFLGFDFERAVAAGLQLGDAIGLDVETDGQ